MRLENFTLTTQIARRLLNDVDTKLTLTKENFDIALPFGQIGIGDDVIDQYYTMQLFNNQTYYDG